MFISNGNNHTLRNAFSHNPLNTSEKYFKFLFYLINILLYFRNQNRSSSRTNGILKSVSSLFFVFD